MSVTTRGQFAEGLQNRNDTYEGLPRRRYGMIAVYEIHHQEETYEILQWPS